MEKELKNDTLERNIVIFLLRHLYKLKYSEISKLFNISNCRVQQIHNKQARKFKNLTYWILKEIGADYEEVTKHQFIGTLLP